jgi:hypothetical protein
MVVKLSTVNVDFERDTADSIEITCMNIYVVTLALAQICMTSGYDTTLNRFLSSDLHFIYKVFPKLQCVSKMRGGPSVIDFVQKVIFE